MFLAIGLFILFQQLGTLNIQELLVLAPMMAGLAATQSSLVALAIGAGSVFFCHVNDAGFWMVREYFGLQLKQTIWVWSVLQTIVSVVGLVGTLLLWHFLT